MAAGPLVVARERMATLGERQQQRVGSLRGERRAPRGRRDGATGPPVEAAVDQARRRAGGGLGPRHRARIVADGERDRHRVRVDPQHAPVQVAELRGQPRVALDERQRAGRLVVEELEVEHPVPEADRTQEAAREVERARLRVRGQPARHLPAHERLRARIHHRVDDPERVHRAVPHPAVEVVLPHVRRHRRLEQHPVRGARLGEPCAADAVERLDEPADHPQLALPEAGVRAQRVAVRHLARQHRERGLHRLDEGRIREALGDRAAVARLERRERDVRLRCDPLHHAARVQLVLGGQDALGRRARQPEPLGDQRGGERAELLVVRQHAAPAEPPAARRLPVGEALDVEADQRAVAREREQVEAGGVEPRDARAPEPLERVAVPVVGEQPADARNRVAARLPSGGREGRGDQRVSHLRAP